MTRPLSAKLYAWLAAGVVVFTLYGSYVPFHTRPRDLADVTNSFRWAMANRAWPQSRSDGAANFALGIPLGFCALAALRIDRRGTAETLLTAAAVWPACVLFAAAVEFGQLYFPERTCAGSDVLAQAVGAAVGMAAFAVAGQRLTNLARAAWEDPRAGGRVGRLLLLYGVVLVVTQLLPLDLTASPADWYRNFRNGAVRVPFGELGQPTPPPLTLLSNWIILGMQYFLAGLLASRLRVSMLQVVASGFLFALVIEASQLTVSRRPSATDVLIGGCGVLMGFTTGRAWVTGLTPLTAVALGQVWFLLLAFVGWQPFQFAKLAQLPKIGWIPFEDLYLQNYLFGPERAAVRVLITAPFGVLVAAAGRAGWWTPWAGAGAAVGCVLLLEVGQMFLPARTPSSTDVVLAAVGGWAGAAITARVRTLSRESPA